tara:strand:- start:4611 stop:5972 length:1362 start_codon:yes stop_codon:yes gene_type:complete
MKISKELKSSLNKESTLRGSSIISGLKSSKGISRTDHYISNVLKNKAFDFYRQKYESFEESKEIISKKFFEYRKSWKIQPQESIKKLRENPDLVTPLIPLCLDLELAAICDLACPYCFRQTYVTPDKVMPSELAFDLIDQASEMGIPSIKFNWRGEPLLNPKIPEIIRYAKNKGILDTMINTNATRLSKDLAKKLIKAGIDQIIFSFDGGTKETYEKNRIGRFSKNYFENVYANIFNFYTVKKELGAQFPWTKIQMILTPETYAEQEQFINLFKNCVDEVVVNQYSERGQSIELLTKEEKEQYEIKRRSLKLPENAPFMKLNSGEILISSARLPCEQPFQRLMVTYDGRVSMCCYDWGSMYSVGYVSDKCFKNLNYDKEKIVDSINKNKPAFKEMTRAKMPPQYNLPEFKVKLLKDIWKDKHISLVRSMHAKCKGDKINICNKCTFKDTYDWK